MGKSRKISLVCAFVAFDPADYFIESDQFFTDPENQKILDLLH